MKCPFCGNEDDKVVDSRLSKDGDAIRRRRQCLTCEKRFTTYERIDELEILIVKKDGSREVFDRGKLRGGIMKSLQKRPVSLGQVESFLDSLELYFQENNIREVAASALGEQVIAWLKGVDEVAYVRFASVYREFRDVQEFMRELESIIAGRQKNLEKL
ncbi:MAG: transcriptional regulator NrdR [Desulfarculales bacterium]|jgi:transcriptional repressor NrdR|nr:transcriptional regulator NrdR [Desulfarculales bacterium]